MSLEKYREKRRFESTPEPAGKAGPAGGPEHFVVQEHRARRLHWDLRLEVNGVLRSWAVPRGPTLDPAEKRLAVRTEDHPLDYLTFEGRIPEGNYGAGTMIVWDAGLFVPKGDPDAEIQKGELKFSLKGHKLRGEFALVRLRPREESKQEEWLLLKHRDSYADSGWTIEDHGGSVLQVKRPEPAGLEGATPAPLPGRIDVMLASPLAEAFSSEDWLYEIKWDGMRAVATVSRGQLKLHARSGREVTASFPELTMLAERVMAREAVLDGEIVVLEPSGQSNFERLQPRMHARRPSVVVRRDNPVDYYVFDLLYCDGYDLRGVPLVERKRLLEQVLDPLPPVRLSDHILAKGRDLYRLASERGAEGIVAKRLYSVYAPGRSEDWLKVKSVKELDAVIGGFTRSRSAGRAFGALLAGLFDGDRLEFIGGVGSGFSGRVLQELAAKLKPLVTDEPPFAEAPEVKEEVTWVKPELVARIAYRELTSDRRLRGPVYKGLRDDILPDECTVRTETPRGQPTTVQVTSAIPVLKDEEAIEAELSGGKRDEVILEIDGKPVRVRNLNKTYFPEPGYTKRRLLHWYYRIAELLLPFLRGRPLVLHRYPNGVAGKPFYQKDAGLERPEWIDSVTLASEGGRRDEITYYVANDRAALLFLTNLGCIEHNPWSSSLPDLETPDYFFFDLDPVENTPYATVVAVAREFMTLLEEAGCRYFLKTSGASGMHIYLPLERAYTYDQVRGFAEIVARLVAGRLPEKTTLARQKEKRPAGAVYLDYSQNGYGRPLASVYSVRPRPEASIAAPLRKSELRRTLEPSRFTLATMPRRLAKTGDLWSGFWDSRQRIEKALARLTEVVSG